MPVQDSFFEPFDKTWDEVSVTMNAHINRLAQPAERDWLGALIKGVKDERDEWLNTVLQPGFETLGWAYSGGQL